MRLLELALALLLPALVEQRGASPLCARPLRGSTAMACRQSVTRVAPDQGVSRAQRRQARDQHARRAERGPRAPPSGPASRPALIEPRDPRAGGDGPAQAGQVRVAVGGDLRPALDYADDGQQRHAVRAGRRGDRRPAAAHRHGAQGGGGDEDIAGDQPGGVDVEGRRQLVQRREAEREHRLPDVKREPVHRDDRPRRAVDFVEGGGGAERGPGQEGDDGARQGQGGERQLLAPTRVAPPVRSSQPPRRADGAGTRRGRRGRQGASRREPWRGARTRTGPGWPSTSAAGRRPRLT